MNDDTTATPAVAPGQDPLPRGVTRRTLKNGQVVHLVQDGTGSRRRSATFTELADAAAYKTYLATCRQQATDPLDPESWRDRQRQQGRRRRGTTFRQLLDEAVAEKTRHRPRSSRSYRTHRQTALRTLEHLGIDADAHRAGISAQTARDIRDRLAVDGYATGSATPVLDLLSTGARLAAADRRIDTNPFDGLRALPQTGRRRSGHHGRKAPVFDISHIVAIAEILPRDYRLPYWLAVTTGMRIGEIFGLRLEDYNPDTGWLSIRRQRAGGAHSIVDTTKTPAGQRQIPLPRWTADALDTYIAEHHDQPAEGAVDGETLLIVGARNRRRPGPMDPDALRTNIRAALATLGLDAQSQGGDIAPVHHLRATMISWLAGDPDVPPAMLSVYVGHNVATHSDPGIQAASKTTRYYTKATSDGLVRVADGMQRLIETRIIGEHGLHDPLGDNALEQPITVDAAATALDVTAEDVLALVRDGTLRARRIDGGTGSCVMLDEADVRARAADRAAEAQDSLPSTQAARRLGVALTVLRQLVDDGTLTAYGNPGERPKPRGIRGGHGRGGQRITIASIEAFEAAHPERTERLTRWLTAPQAAAILGCSADTIRRQVDRGELIAWTDPYNRRSERRIDPDQIARLATRSNVITVADAAARLGTTPRKIQAVLAELRNGRTGGSPHAMSADEYDIVCQRHGTVADVDEAVRLLGHLIDQGKIRPVAAAGGVVCDLEPLLGAKTDAETGPPAGVAEQTTSPGKTHRARRGGQPADSSSARSLPRAATSSRSTAASSNASRDDASRIA